MRNPIFAARLSFFRQIDLDGLPRDLQNPRSVLRQRG
jgi:hypothetical protein